MEINVTPADALRIMARADKDSKYPILEGFALTPKHTAFKLAVEGADPDLKIKLHPDGTWTATCGIYV